MNIVSNASRVLTPAEQRYTTGELELMAIVYALRKFRVYIYGHNDAVSLDHNYPDVWLTVHRNSVWIRKTN